MLLRESDIAAFVANWNDKASNLRVIAKTLELGLDSFVFLDDNPAADVKGGNPRIRHKRNRARRISLIINHDVSRNV